MEIKEPLFIVGSGRSGSTLLLDILSKHENLAWITPSARFFPGRPSLNRLLLHLNDFPLLGRFFSIKIKPGEYYDYWDSLFPGFSMPFRDLKDFDVSKKVKKNIQQSFFKIPTRKRSKLIVKITGWPRIGFLQEIYPNAKFIYIKRDPFAFVNSILQVKWWWGWRGSQNWRFGPLSDKYSNQWKDCDYSFAALATIEFLIIDECVQEYKHKFNSNQLFELKYEDLCKNPLVELEKTCNFLNMKFSKKFQKKINSFSFKNTNDKYLNDLSENQIEMIRKILELNNYQIND